MKKLIDIKGYWNKFGAYNFNDSDMWQGKILLEEDGWFEGFVTDPNSIYYKGDRFIFGVYHPEKAIELFKITKVNILAQFLFHGKRAAEGYDGEFETIGLFGSMTFGASRIITQYAEAVRENTDAETDELENKIQRYKRNMYGKEFYDSLIPMRNSMCQIVLRNYEGRGFTSEETQRIMEECQPVNDRVMSAPEQEAKRLVKKMAKNLFENNGDLSA